MPRGCCPHFALELLKVNANFCHFFCRIFCIKIFSTLVLSNTIHGSLDTSVSRLPLHCSGILSEKMTRVYFAYVGMCFCVHVRRQVWCVNHPALDNKISALGFSYEVATF